MRFWLEDFLLFYISVIKYYFILKLTHSFLKQHVILPHKNMTAVLPVQKYSYFDASPYKESDFF